MGCSVTRSSTIDLLSVTVRFSEPQLFLSFPIPMISVVLIVLVHAVSYLILPRKGAYHYTKRWWVIENRIRPRNWSIPSHLSKLLVRNLYVLIVIYLPSGLPKRAGVRDKADLYVCYSGIF
ncbi:hypothetical protein Y032_0415g1053 [Ancylostoma ceylanicum]|uniref:Uncharacterized protein n=1 Tax=Ancylostoma ceylanicum TaxID=53326 RepID=A0A016X2Q7_9BILA|nr:hypothetical protein Y032_0415g1053 [Ancylostoma ceylanicum]